MADRAPQLESTDIEEALDRVELLAREAKSVERRARVMKRLAAQAAEALTDLKGVTENNERSKQD